jgi:hypothetical protein
MRQSTMQHHKRASFGLKGNSLPFIKAGRSGECLRLQPAIDPLKTRA